LAAGLRSTYAINGQAAPADFLSESHLAIEITNRVQANAENGHYAKNCFDFLSGDPADAANLLPPFYD
jgi:hypothetical protein